MDAERAIASILKTPIKRKPAPLVSPEKVKQCKLVHTEAALASDQPKMVEDDASSLSKLFTGLEIVLILFASRKRRAAFDIIRADVEDASRRDFTEGRLAQVLHIAGDMLCASLVGAGNTAHLEICQKAQDGECRPPTPAELSQRQQCFDARAASTDFWKSTVTLPSNLSIPERTDMVVVRSGRRDAVVKACSPLQPVAKQEVSDSKSRMDALRQRLQAKEEQSKAQKMWQEAVDTLERQVRVCEDAIAVHAIVEQLFARGEGCVEASEAEVLQAACSASFSAQCRRPLDPPRARAALDCLMARAERWFQTRAPRYSQRIGLLLQQIPGGSSSAAMDSLRKYLRDVKQSHDGMVQRGPILEDRPSCLCQQQALRENTTPTKSTSTPARRRLRKKSLGA